ncbi:tetrapyrrole methylase [Zopfochytrium polystomum]|nr:tetrapyrrole methylase [Zopfochytrium polystomum]
MVVATTSTTEPALAAIVPGTQQPVSTATITPLLPPAPSPTAGGLLVSLRLNSRRVLVIGGGKEAVGRIFNSLDAGATVHLLAPYEDLLPQVKAFVDDGKSPTPSAEILREEPYSLYDIVLGCSDDHDESVAIAKAARDARIPVNCADVPDLCDFYFVALHRDGPLQVGVSTNGCGPRMAARIRNMIREALPKCTGAAIAAVGRLRTKVKMLDADLANAGRRMSWVSKFCDLWEMEELAAMNDDDMEKILDAYEKGEEPPRKTGVLVAGGATAATGGHHAGPTLYLVGGGPGDPGLLTLRGYHALQSADVIVSDQLISEELIAVIPKHARLVFVERKVKGRSDAAQTDANLLCLEELQKLASTPGLRGGGGSVVRLKGGDPFLFGRGGEEALFMRDAGFRVVVVPGVTSSIAAPASAGIPVTHRGVADQVLVVSARGEGGSLPDIPPYAPRRTIVVLMPVARMAVLAELMMGGGGGGGGDGEEGRGFPPDTPAAVVERGTCVDERVVEGTLRNIAARIADAAVGSPALLVVGDVCSVLRTSV